MTAGTGPPPPGLAELVRAWARELQATRYIPMTRGERFELLTGLAGRLAAAVLAEPFDRAEGYRVGVDLVNAGYAVPESLGRTLSTLSARLLPDLELAGAAARTRLEQLLAELATGFARASRDAILEGQDAVRLAAWAAQHQLEGALRVEAARFRHAALHDALTGLPNRLAFTEWLAASCADPAPGARVGVCFIGLDSFRKVNDSLGHPAGDRLLVAVAERLRELATAAGYRLAHLGGDEFAVLVRPDAGAADPESVADQILLGLQEPFPIDGLELPVSASVGTAATPVAGVDPAEMMRAADAALDWAKGLGGGQRAAFEQERSEREVARYRRSVAMPGALARGEFTLRYQPLVRLADSALAGVEALARWHHPTLGLLSAEEFIGLAEGTGLIVPLGHALLEQACREAAGWPQLVAAPPFVSVNIAVRQLHQPELAASIAEVLDRTGLPPGMLQLEITESAFIDREREVLETLKEIGDLGVRIVIDDLGTGYSNLANLYLLPVHGFKLAARFVKELAWPSPEYVAFLSSVVSFGRNLGLTVTAEGIETAAQARQLRRMGCEFGQGWHFGRPCSAAELARRLGGGQRRSA